MLGGGALGESPSGFFNDGYPRRVVPDLVTFSEKAVDLTPDKLHQATAPTDHARWRKRSDLTQPGSTCVHVSVEHSGIQRRSPAHQQTLRVTLTRPRGLERTVPARRPPLDADCWRRDHSDLDATSDRKSNVDAKVRAASAEERRPIDRIENPHPVRLAATAPVLFAE